MLLHRTRELMVSVLLCATAVLQIAILWRAYLNGNISNSDFGSLWESGRAALHGLDPYAAYPLTFVASFPALPGILEQGIVEVAINRNTPATLPILSALALLEPMVARTVWWGITTILYVGAIIILHRLYPAQRGKVFWFWLAAFAPFWHTMHIGHLHMLMGILVLVIWCALRVGRSMLAGAALGLLIAMKPHFGVVLLFLLVGSYHRVAITSVVAAGVATLGTAALYGPTVYLRWLDAALATPWVGWPLNIPVHAVAARLHAPLLGYSLAAVLLVATLAWVARRRPGPESLLAVASTTTLLVAPSGWPGYLLVLLPAIFWWRWSSLVLVVGALLAIPHDIIWAVSQRSALVYVLIGSTYTYILLGILVNLIRLAPRPTVASAAVVNQHAVSVTAR